MSHYGSLAAQKKKMEYCCDVEDGEDIEGSEYGEDVLDISRFVMDGDGDGSGSDSEESYEDYDWTDPVANCVTSPAECTTPPAVKTKAELKLQRSHQEPCFNPNDPLRYCVDMGFISMDEYNRWKIVEEPSSNDRTRRALDFGPGYNSDSDSESDGDAVSTPTSISRFKSYGTGYMQDSNGIAYDPWFPNLDDYNMSKFVVFENDPNDLHSQPPASISRLNSAFGLKILWERFVGRKGRCTLQEFWQTSAIDIYEALQELVAMHAELFNSTNATKHIPGAQEFHANPVEMLEHTFETIGRMSRCIAEDFNTESCVNYVEEFVRALYIELRFIGQRALHPVTPWPTA